MLVKKYLNESLIFFSSVLLALFLGFWLHEEFGKTKKAMELERKTDFFSGILSTLNSDTITEIKFQDPFTRQNKELITIKIEGKIDSAAISKKDTTFTYMNIEKVEEFPESFKIFGKDSMKVSTRFEYNEITDEMDTIINLNIGPPIEGKDIVFLAEVDEDLTFWKVVRGMRLQIFMAFFIFGSVLMAFIYLRRSLAMEKQLAVLKNDFISNITHELKTPVSTIGVALEALKNFGAAERKELRDEYIDITLSEINRLGLLVDKALNISLFEKGAVRFQHEVIDIREELDKIQRTLKIHHDAHQVDLSIQAEGKAFQVKGDKTHFVNVLHNLIENAIKYSGEGDPVIRVEVLEKEDKVVVKVSDEGIGIPAEYKERIFDKFFRVPQGDVHDQKGYGLGLSYVKMVVKEMGGEIQVESAPGKGSIFAITLPKIYTDGYADSLS